MNFDTFAAMQSLKVGGRCGWDHTCIKPTQIPNNNDYIFLKDFLPSISLEL